LVIDKAGEKNFSFLSGEPFFAENTAGGRHHIRLSFSFVPQDQFDAGIQVLADAIRAVSGR
jgi:DNA-binding transcriptional MocR family regulator